MGIFEAQDFDHHEAVVFFDDKASGLKAIIAIHSTTLGPACGGTRMYPYASSDDAMTDVLRLSRGMSYKSAMAELPLGGGKAVIMGSPHTDITERKLLAYAEAVNALGGRYITAMDVGIGPKELPVIARGTKYAAGFDQPGKTGGDSGPMTTLGTYVGLKAAVKHRLKTDTAKDMTVAIQGLGKVGMGLAASLHREGARLIVADTDEKAVRAAVDQFGAKAVAPDEIVTVPCDVLSPNALGAILNDKTIPALKAKVVAGAANNQLARDNHGQVLRELGILYAPDYVINAGGIIRVAGQIFGWDDTESERRTRNIANTLTAIFRRSEAEGRPTSVIADHMAVERIRSGASAKAAE